MPREILTLNTKLYVNRGNGDENLIDLLSTPDLGVGDAEKIEVTNLQDGTRRYINGIKDVGDSLEFEFNYTTDTYDILKEIEDSKQIYTYKVVLPGENNVEDGLCFSFKAALSVKVTGAAVGEQIKMTINLTPYSAISVGEYEEGGNEPSQQNEYSTFTFRGTESATYNTRNAGMVVMMNNTPNSITELYVNNEPQQVPQISMEEMMLGEGGDDVASLLSILQVSEGDIIRVKGGFSLFGNSLFENIINISDIELQSDLENCSYMFTGCATLIEAPIIPSTARNCSYMFMSCTTLTEAPIIPSSVKDCSYMFMGCENLVTIPQENIDLMNNPAGGLVTQGCFEECIQIKDQIPKNWGGNAAPIYPIYPVHPVTVEYTTFTIEETGTLFIVNNSDEICVTELYINGNSQQLPQFSFMELRTSELPMEEKIQQISALQVTKGDNIKIKGGFVLVNGIIPAECVPINNLLLQTLGHYEYMFYNYTGLTDVLYASLPVGNYTKTFNGTNITYAPFIDESSIIYYTFANCGNLRSIASEYIDAFNNNPLEDGGNGCFADSTNIEEPIAYSQIPMGWKNSN